MNGATRGFLSFIIVASLVAQVVPLQLSSEPLQESEWRIENVDFTEKVGWFTSIALDTGGRVHISYNDETNHDLKYAWWNGSAWINETVDTDGHVGYYTSIKLDDLGIPHISYQQYHPDLDLKYAWKDGGVWHDEIIDSAGAVGYYTSIVLDGKGKPHISYYDHTKGDLKFAWKNGDGWKYMAVDSPGVVGQYTSMALDLNGNFHISYFDYENGDLKHAWKEGGVWKNETVDSGGNVGHDTSIAFDGPGYPHISYFDQTNQDLKHAWKEGGVWKNETVDSGGNVGYDTSIAFDGSGDAHISYYDQTNFNLKHAWKNGTVWKNEIVDSIGDVGRYASMVIDNESIPHISYFNRTSHDLKYATKVKLQENDPPVADAGPDQTVSVGDIVQFDGSGSYDLDSPLFLSNETIVNDDTSNAKQISPSIAVDDFGNVHTLWSDDRSGNLDVFYSVLNETVGKFSPNIRVNDDAGDRHQFARDLDIDHQGTVHALFGDGRNSRILIDVYYANLTIGSSGFDKNLMVNDDGPGQSYQAPTHIDADSAGNVHAVWWDGRLGVQASVDVFYAKRIHDQASFSSNVRVNEYIQEYQASPFVLVDDELVVHVVWNDHRDSTGWRIYYANSTDHGQTFNENVKVNDIDGSFRMRYPQLAFGRDGEMVVVWYDERDGGGNIYMSKLEPGQSSFSKNERVNDVLDTVNHSTIAIASDASGRYHLVWQDSRDGNADVYYMFITPDGQFSTSFRVNRIKDAYQRLPSIAVDPDGNPHFVWLSNASGDYDTIYLGSSGQDLKYEWDFGDGHHGTGVKPMHAYDSPGVFNVVLTVTDSLGATDTDNCKITVLQSGQPPVADAGGPYFALEGEQILFNASGSHDPNGNALHYRWDFDNDSVWDTNWSTEPIASHTWYDDHYGTAAVEVAIGINNSKAVVSDGDIVASAWVGSVYSQAQSFIPGMDILEKVHVDVAISSPTETPDAPICLQIRESLHSTDLTSICLPPEGLPRVPPIVPGWVEFDFPDITVEPESTYFMVLTSSTKRWVYETHPSDDLYPDGVLYHNQSGGWYPVQLDLRFKILGSEVGASAIAYADVTVENTPPIANADGPYNGFEGSPIEFIGNHTDPGPLDTHTYEWDFSYDGTTFNSESTGNPYQKTWWDDHTGNIALRVTDDDGGWDLDVTTVTIVNVPPIANAGDDKEGYEVSTFTFNGSFYDPGSNDTHEFEWDFDYDGITFDVEATGKSTTHTWTDDFDGQIALRVTDDDGGADIDTAHVLVKNVAPTVTLGVLPIEVDAFLRMAGEKWHDVSIELFEDGVLIANGTLVRYPGSPNDQMLDFSNLQFDHSKNYAATVTYTPDDDSVNGQTNGANPCWIILRFDDGQELWIHHTFNVKHPDTYVWEVDLTAAILSHGMTFEATAFDPGADEHTFHWDFGDGTNATSFYSNANWTYPVQITETINHAFPGSGTYTVVLTVEDDDGGVGTASLTIVIP